MKKYLLLAFLSINTIAFTSCDKDDDEVNATENDISGVWNLTTLETSDGQTEIISEGESVVTQFEAFGKDFDVVVNFDALTKTVESEGRYTTVITSTLMGETTTEEQEGQEFFDANTWRLDGNMLYFSTGDEEQGFTIVNLNDNKMDLRYEINQEQEVLGLTINISANYNMTLTR